MDTRNVTIREVARAAEVSIGTVSRVLNGHKSVRADVRRHVQQVISDLGYEVDVAARNMRGGRTKTIAIALRDFSIPATAITLQVAESVFRAAGYTVLLANTNDDRTVELALLREFKRRRVDGIIMTISDETDDELLEALRAVKVPVVLNGRDSVNSVDRVLSDLRGGTAQAVDYLLSLGHRRIALLTGKPRAYPGRGRIEGFRDAYRKAGLVPPEDLIRARSFSSEFGFTETSYLIDLPAPPTAIIAGGMAMLPGVLRALRLGGLRTGNDMSVIAGCDSDLAELAAPAITAISWDFAAAGRFCAEMLIQRIENASLDPPRCLTLPSMLILRESCHALDRRDPG
ncbi:LacI family DNA-binding transcriptional regulator [Microvirga calopogonii]|uniref:LacI family DNA-binding transcriptional regulator n=1 Tax=Microvirga calopogonii TaxID=2078013 RepID=UPI000E0DF8D7|nr:LacI family DNA-binding transcriptional regulator [Microvirga calopogonii]